MTPRWFLLFCLALPACVFDADDDGTPFKDDCDDADAERFAGNVEICDGKDNDCNGIIDDGLLTAFYVDSDGDGYGDPSQRVERCEAGPNEVEDKTDCNDQLKAANPDASEICDEIDNDCDGDVDEGDAVDAPTWFQDRDRDEFGTPDKTIVSCDPGDGWSLDDSDCDDGNKTVHPDADEICDGEDNNCDDIVDLDAIDRLTYHADSDGDLYGDPDRTRTACDQPDGWLVDATDCDDDDRDEHPGALWWPDFDRDGFGDAEESTGADCERVESTDVTDHTDCDDLRRDINPGAAEVWYDGTDQDCDEASDYDKDGDGYEIAPYGDDCDDEAKLVRPGARELHDQKDNDCDDLCDEGFISAGDLVVTEFMPDPTKVTDSYGEWFEVYNDSGDDIAVCGGWVIKDKGLDSHTLKGPFTIKKGDYFVFGRSTDRGLNGNVGVDYAHAGFYLANGEDEIVVVFDDKTIDEVSYDFDVDNWASFGRAGNAAQLDATSIDATDNDDSYSWCASIRTYGAGDYGSPGGVNDTCSM